jgi:ATP-dependent DNA ligase
MWTLDGEVVYINPKTGEEEFTSAQRRCATQFPDYMLRDSFPITFEAFDVLKVKSGNTEKIPYWKRKELLQQLLSKVKDATVQFVPFQKDLLSAWEEAISMNREGLIAKQIESPYEHERSYSWLKVKNWLFEVCNVVGYTAGENARNSFFGSLVLADENGRYRGCVGSGFNEWELRKTKDQLSDSPKPLKASFSYEQVGEPYRAISTNLQVLVKYYQTTAKNVMRMPIFITSN